VRLPDDETLQYIEDRHNITIEREGIMSEEGCKTYDIPAFYANNGKGDGSQTALCTVDDKVYVVLKTMIPSKSPVPIFTEFRKRKPRG